VRSAIAIVLGLLLACPAGAGIERVWIRRTSPDAVTVQRANGDLWRLGLDSQCPLLSADVRRVVLIHFPVSFPGPELHLLVPELDLACRAIRADSVGHRAPPAPEGTPDPGLIAMRETLEALGYDCGPLQDRGWTPDAAQAFTRYRERRQLDGSPEGLRHAVTALAIDALGGHAPSATGLRRSQAIENQSDEIVDFLVNGGSAECGDPTFVRAVAPDSSYFSLVDGTVWIVELGARGAVAGWLSSDEVMACSGRLVNVRTGEMARATRLR
jgi:hypothetical protein